MLSEYCLFQLLLLCILKNCISPLHHRSSPMTYGIPTHALSFQLLLSHQVNFITVRTFLLINMSNFFNVSWHNNRLQNRNQRICHCMIHWLTDALSTPTSYKVLLQICQILLDFLAFFPFKDKTHLGPLIFLKSKT